MSAHPDTQATILVADYLAIDGGGKLNAIGINTQLQALQPNGATPPMHVAVLIDFPPQMFGERVPVTIELRDLGLDQVVSLPQQPGQPTPQALRITQLLQIDRPRPHSGTSAFAIPDDLPSRTRWPWPSPTGCR